MLIHFHRLAHFMFVKKIPFLPKLIYYIQYIIFNSSLPPSTKIGKNTKFAYGGIGVVIHGKTIIGENCIIGQGITIGGKSKSIDVPRIGNKVYLSAGCRILGNVVIGNNAIVGANAVVVKDVPANSIVAGIPAKVIKSDIIPENYY